jgi:hypothetical protein
MNVTVKCDVNGVWSNVWSKSLFGLTFSKVPIDPPKSFQGFQKLDSVDFRPNHPSVDKR